MMHKKCHIANFTLGLSFTKQNNDDKRNKFHISFRMFRVGNINNVLLYFGMLYMKSVV